MRVYPPVPHSVSIGIYAQVRWSQVPSIKEALFKRQYLD